PCWIPCCRPAYWPPCGCPGCWPGCWVGFCPFCWYGDGGWGRPDCGPCSGCRPCCWEGRPSAPKLPSPGLCACVGWSGAGRSSRDECPDRDADCAPGRVADWDPGCASGRGSPGATGGLTRAGPLLRPAAPFAPRPADEDGEFGKVRGTSGDAGS